MTDLVHTGLDIAKALMPGAASAITLATNAIETARDILSRVETAKAALTTQDRSELDRMVEQRHLEEGMRNLRIQVELLWASQQPERPAS